MKASIWSPSFKLKNGEGGYLEQSNVDIPDNVKIGDKISMYSRYKCEVQDIYIENGETTLKLNVIDTL